VALSPIRADGLIALSSDTNMCSNVRNRSDGLQAGVQRISELPANNGHREGYAIFGWGV